MSLFSFGEDYPKAKKDFTVAIVIAEFNSEITEKMLEAALKTLKKCKIPEDNIFVEFVAGAFEIPFAVKTLIHTGDFDGVITLGAVIRGETPHFDFVAGECARGIMNLNVYEDVPTVFGVLTCDTSEQAVSRIEKGSDVAIALVKQMNFSLSYK